MIGTLRRPVGFLRSVRFDRQREHLDGFLRAARLGSVQAAASLLGQASDPQNDEQIRCDLDRYTFFDGKLHVSGKVKSEGSVAVVGMGMRVPGHRRTWLEPGFVTALAPDSDGWSAFSFSVACPDVYTSLGWRLCAAKADGSWSDLGQARHRTGLKDDFDQTVPRFWALLSQRGPGRLLEIGARARSGVTHVEGLPPGWEYVGFDIAGGPNVDVVGDAHELSTHFEPESFDAVLSMSTFEHLAMPWVVAVEINRVLKPGGLVCVTTHQTYPVHEAPWDFWRFSEYTWPILFNPSTGFEIVKAAMGQQAQVVPVLMNDITADNSLYPAFLATIAIARKTGSSQLRWEVPPSDVVSGEYSF